MKKTLVLALVLLVPLASASVDDVTFEELPTAWETGEELEFSMDSEGAGLDRVLLQSRRPGEPGFTDRRSKICTGYSSCDWDLQHSETQTRTFEYRFRVSSSQEDYENSRTQRVRYYSDLDYSVEWTEEPPETASRYSDVEMSVTAHDSTSRFDDEGVLYLQYRDDSGDWETFDSRSCSSSGTSDTCSNHGSTSLNNEKLQDGTARFRGLIVFQGDISAVSSIRTVSLPGRDGSIDHVDLDSLPDEVEDGDSFDITADAEGENLQTLYIQKRDPDAPGWTDWRSKDCDGDSDCSFTRTYHVDGTGEMEFRAYVEATGDSDASNGQTVDFVPEADERVDSVTLDRLPDEWEVDEDLDVTGEAEGHELDEIILRTRERGESWDEVYSEDCYGDDECDFDYSFDPQDTGDLEFQLLARAGGDSKTSNRIEVVEFYGGDEVDYVELDDLPSDYETDRDLEITGEAEGDNLERIILEKRDPGDDWEEVETEDCDRDDECYFNHDYEQDEEEEVDFRLVAETEHDSETSDIETVEFQDDADDIDFVSIDELPDEYETGEDLEIHGEAEGEDLDSIIIEEKDSDEDHWDDYREKDCDNEDYCEITRDFSTDNEEEKDFRIRVEAGNDEEYSGTETVNFQDDVDDRIDQVDIDSLPDEYDTGEDLEISGDAEGENLDRLIIQERDSDEDDWNRYGTEDCDNQDSCSISRDFSTSREVDKEFRLKAEAGDDEEYSSIEEVSFRDEEEVEGSIARIIIDEVIDTVQTGTEFTVSGEMEGELLDSLEVQRRTRSTSWATIESEDCSGSSCSISTERTESEAGGYEFRLKGMAGDDTDFSGIQVVDVYGDDEDPEPPEDTGIDSVSMNNLPSEHPTGQSLQLRGSATGSDLEEIRVQTRTDGDWSDYRTEDCEGADSCSISVSYTSGTPEDVEFRIQVSSNEETRSTAGDTVKFYITRSVNFVRINELPDRIETGGSFGVTGEMEGENLDSIEIQKRRQGSTWQVIESGSCSGSSCSLNTEETLESTGSYEYRVRGSSGGNVEYSGIEVVDVYSPEDDGSEAPETRELSVNLDGTPSEKLLGSRISLTASGEGENLEDLTIEARNDTGGDWYTLGTEDCGGVQECSETSFFSAETAGDYYFRAVLSNGTDSVTSAIRSTEFTAETDVASVSIDELPDEYFTGQELVVTGEATGSNLDQLVLQKRSRDSSWKVLDSRDCSGDSCDLSYSYVQDSPESTEFRFYAVAGDETSYSGIEVVNFRESDREVSIEDLPAEYPVDQELEVRGSSNLLELEELALQTRTDGDNWENLSTRECSSSPCSIEDSFTEENTISRDFRVKAFTEQGEETSSTEEVEFVDEVSSEGSIDSVTLSSLPDEYEVDEELDIDASAEGEYLDSLEIQRKEDDDWEILEEKDCEDSSDCSIETEYTADEPGSVEFRAKAEAGLTRRYSDRIEVVEFTGEDVSDSDTGLDVYVEDEDGDDLEDARVRVRNGDSDVDYTDDDGESFFDLEPDDYEVRVSKSGYETEERDVEIEQNERRYLRFELDETDEEREFFVSMDYEETVCRGDDLEVEVRLTNLEYRDTFEIRGSGLESDAQTREVTVERDETREVTLVFRDITESDDFRVTVENSERRTLSGSVDVEDCVERSEPARNLPTGISAEIKPFEVVAGETVKIKGDVRNVKQPVDVTASSGGFSRTVSSDRDGGYTIFYTTTSAGEKDIEISAEGVSTERSLEVLPRASVSQLEAPDTVIEGEKFGVCAEVSSDTDANVILYRDGSRLDSKSGSGEVCFEVESGSQGEEMYWVRATTSGETGSASRRVSVIEADEEVDSFPGQVTVEETQAGQARISLYNTESDVKRFEIDVEGIDDSWFSLTDSTVVLAPGERETTHIYFSPSDSGTFRPEIVVESNGETVFSREMKLDSADTGKKSRGLLARLF